MTQFDAVQCPDYLETLAPRQKVANAAVDAICQWPAGTVHMVKAVCGTAGLPTRTQETSGLIELLFDNFSHPVLAGARSAGMSIRQLLYRAEPYQIDLQLEAQPERNRLAVTGQFLDVRDPELVGRDVQVTLSDGRGSDVHTMTNQFGEFRGEVENSGYLELSFLGRSEKPIVILLRRALS